MFSSVQQSALVTGTPVQVFSVSGLASPRDVILASAGPETAYAAGTSSADTTGFPLPPQSQLVLTGPAVNLWAVTASGTAQVTGSLGTDVLITALQDALMVRVAVDDTGPQVFDLRQYPGAVQDELPLAVLGPAGDPAALTWPAFAPVWAGGPLVNPAGMLGYALLANTGGNTVYAGGSGVSATTGVPVAPGQRLLLLGPAPDALYAACASGRTSSMVTGLATVTAIT